MVFKLQAKMAQILLKTAKFQTENACRYFKSKTRATFLNFSLES